MNRQVNDQAAYNKVIAAFKKQRKGATAADITARTALPLAVVREMVPRAADEFSGRLEVTESGEILYSFPHGFTSKYRGFGPAFSRFFARFCSGVKALGILLFKIWIMVMLVGYFVLFLLIALAAVLLSVAAKSSNSNSRSRGDGGAGIFLGGRILDLVFRIWFYSELSRSFNGRPVRGPVRSGNSAKKAPLYKSIFSFVFGDGDPNKGWEETEKKTVIAYLQTHRGVISLPEYMVLSGREPIDAEEALMAFCAEFGGSPEATDEGTVVYRFDELLLRNDKQDRSFAGASAPLKRLKAFSQNKGGTNFWVGLINTVNLLFGSYFLVNALTTGIPPAILNNAPQRISSLYDFTIALFYQLTGANPLTFVTIGLGFVPLIFSVLFWLIPAIRFFTLKGENESLKLENFRKIGYGRIWSAPSLVKSGEIKTAAAECKPRSLSKAEDRVIKDMGAIALPDITIDAAGAEVYSFGGLEREKAALEKYRAGIDGGASDLGKTVFDSHDMVIE
ncbi:hypothetical protein AGMMS49928_01100 [Spirochaetia bacterium]|nr:hypothetical protein AGMMS49928_01100 [Spirochaetia bacterium]